MWPSTSYHVGAMFLGMFQLSEITTGTFCQAQELRGIYEMRTAQRLYSAGTNAVRGLESRSSYFVRSCLEVYSIGVGGSGRLTITAGGLQQSVRRMGDARYDGKLGLARLMVDDGFRFLE